MGMDKHFECQRILLVNIYQTWLILWIIDAGRCPEFEVRKVNFQGIEESPKVEPFEPLNSGSDVQLAAKNIPILSTDVEKADQSHSLLRSPITVAESYDDVRPIRLFVYGVRCHLCAVFYTNIE